MERPFEADGPIPGLPDRCGRKSAVSELHEAIGDPQQVRRPTAQHFVAGLHVDDFATDDCLPLVGPHAKLRKINYGTLEIPGVDRQIATHRRGAFPITTA